MQNSGHKSHRPRRPGGVTILAWLQILQSLASLLIGLAFTLQAGSALGGVPAPLPYLTVKHPMAAFERGVSQLLLAFPVLWVGFALFRLKPWAWLSAMTLQSVVLVVNLVSYVRGGANYLSMAVSIIIVLYLNQAEVRAAFRPRPADAVVKAGMSGSHETMKQ